MESFLQDSVLIAQGAEAKLYKGTYLGKTVLVKERFEKKYRHKILDDRLTKERIKSEAKAIVRAKAAGVCSPALYLVDFNRRSIIMEYIEDSETLQNFINRHILGKTNVNELTNAVTKALGSVIASLHSQNIVHGDLTTSNILIKNVSDLLADKSQNDGN